ncbi:MAG: hypothetical protein F8N15_10560 [Methanobacterium sp.]|nr:hypothetical protein [Methanobacterium sp.]
MAYREEWGNIEAWYRNNQAKAWLIAMAVGIVISVITWLIPGNWLFAHNDIYRGAKIAMDMPPLKMTAAAQEQKPVIVIKNNGSGSVRIPRYTFSSAKSKYLMLQPDGICSIFLEHEKDIIYLDLAVDFDSFKGYVLPSNDEYNRIIVWKNSYEFLILEGGYQMQHGEYIVRGYFRFETGGVHQGMLSVALIRVPDEQVILSANTREYDSDFPKLHKECQREP